MEWEYKQKPILNRKNNNTGVKEGLKAIRNWNNFRYVHNYHIILVLLGY